MGGKHRNLDLYCTDFTKKRKRGITIRSVTGSNFFLVLGVRVRGIFILYMPRDANYIYLRQIQRPQLMMNITHFEPPALRYIFLLEQKLPYGAIFKKVSCVSDWPPP